MSRLSGSNPGFFKMGVMVASLTMDWTEPVVKQVFRMLVMRGLQ